MTRRYWNIIDEEFISYTGGNAIIISNGDFKFAIWETKEDVQKICNKLNEWVDEIKELKEDKHEYLQQKARYEMQITEYIKENKELKSLCKVLITHIKKNSIAFVIDEDVRRLLK